MSKRKYENGCSQEEVPAPKMSFELQGIGQQAQQSKFQKHHNIILDHVQKWEDGGPLYPHQRKALLATASKVMKDGAETFANLLNGINSKPKPVLIVAPTGSGKTGIIVFLPYVLASNKVLIITPSKIITEQIGEAFAFDSEKICFFEKIKMIRNDSPNRDDMLDDLIEKVDTIENSKDITKRLGRLVIVNAQTFSGKSKLSLVYKKQNIIEDVQKFFKNFDTLIVDEAHHFPAKTWVTIVDEFSKAGSGNQKKIIFLTATPYKTIKGREGQFILGEGREAQDRIAITITKEEVQKTTVRELKFVGDGHPNILLRDIQKIFDDNKKIEPRFEPQAMVLVQTIKDAERWAANLNKQSNQKNFAVVVTSKKPGGLVDFTEGKFRVAITCGIGGEGYDNANVITCVILRKLVTGRVLFTQFVGRCMRKRGGLQPNPLRLDQSVGIVRSYPGMLSKELFDTMDTLAEADPEEED